MIRGWQEPPKNIDQIVAALRRTGVYQRAIKRLRDTHWLTNPDDARIDVWPDYDGTYYHVWVQVPDSQVAPGRTFRLGVDHPRMFGGFGEPPLTERQIKAVRRWAVPAPAFSKP